MRKKRTKKFRLLKKTAAGIVLFVFLLAGIEPYLPAGWPVHSWMRCALDGLSYLSGKRDDLPIKSVEGMLRVDFLDVGQGNCTLITLDGHAMLYDCGPEDKGSFLQSCLLQLGVEKLDYVIASHPDADHIGSMDVVLTKFDCDRVFMPDIMRDTASYRDVDAALRYRGYQPYCPQSGEIYDFGSAQFSVLGPIRRYPEDTNNNSIVIRLKYGTNTFLFTGDAQAEEETDLTESGAYLPSQVYLAGHHGSSNASSEAFLDAVRPEYTVISCAAENDYGHPHDRTLDRLRKEGSLIFRTDLQGTVSVTSDGKTLQWSCEPWG